MLTIKYLAKSISMVYPSKSTRTDISGLAYKSVKRCASFYKKYYSHLYLYIYIYIYIYYYFLYIYTCILCMYAITYLIPKFKVRPRLRSFFRLF